MKIYLDMDGVIADFFGKIEDKFVISNWKNLQNPRKTIDGFKNTDWFFNLKPFENSSQYLVDSVRKIAGPYNWGICSSPIHGDEMNSGYHKRRWLEKHSFMPEVNNFIITHEKWKYANEDITGEPNILIDDRPDNILNWKRAGGIGILYQADESCVNELVEDIRARYS